MKELDLHVDTVNNRLIHVADLNLLGLGLWHCVDVVDLDAIMLQKVSLVQQHLKLYMCKNYNNHTIGISCNESLKLHTFIHL